MNMVINPALYVGDWIDALGFERRVAAEFAGTTQSYISNMSGGRQNRRQTGRSPSTRILLALSRLLQISMNDFFVPPPAKLTQAAMADLSPQAVAALMARARNVLGNE